MKTVDELGLDVLV